MIPGYVYDHGARDYNEGISLSRNPYDPLASPGAHEAWRDGWLDASRARGRRLRVLESVARAIA